MPMLQVPATNKKSPALIAWAKPNSLLAAGQINYLVLARYDVLLCTMG
jgi:hypothetical protein|tara:strand:- start:135 stop:278 length:144 start_codon:yes stop_codon:yes gene_type:complete